MVQDQDLPDEEPDEAGGDGIASGANLRAAPRFTLLIRVAKLVADGRDFLCIMRDVSATGAKVRLFADLPDHRELALEFANGDRLPADLVWRSGEYVGLHFREPITIERLLDERGDSSQRRQVRLRIALDAMLHSGGESVRIAFRDFSQQGARIECDKWLMMNELVRLEPGVTPAIYAKVRWRKHPCYGLLFEQTFKLEELARICTPLLVQQGTDPGCDDDRPVQLRRSAD